MARRERGKVSWFGGPGDPSAGSTTASGKSVNHPGISLYDHSTLGGYWRVRMPNGVVKVLQQTDIGPAPWTGRKFDFTVGALPHLGYSTKDFPTDAEIHATYLGKKPPRRRAAGGGASGGSSATASLVDPGKPADVKLAQVPQFDQAGFDKAKSASLVGQLLAGSHGTGGILFKTGVLSTQAPNPADYTKTTLESTAIPGTAPTVKQAPSAPDAGAVAGGGRVDRILARAQQVDRIAPPYKWGGGHGGDPRRLSKAQIRAGLDCSGFVSYAIGLNRPLTSGELANWGHAGPGKVITVYANSTHTFMSVRDPKTGKEVFYGTSGFARPNGGAGRFNQTPSKSYLAKFTKRHPPGL